MKKAIKISLAIIISVVVAGGLSFGIWRIFFFQNYAYTWSISTPAEQNLNATIYETDIPEFIDSDPDILFNSIIVVRNGHIVYEYYAEGYDEFTYRNIWAITNCFASTLIGIAAKEGYLTVDDYMVDYFEDYTIDNMDTDKEAIQIKHLLSSNDGMTDFSSGSLQEMLDQPMVAAPGVVFNYNSGVANLLMYILERATGMPSAKFAEKYLLKPLDFGEYEWPTTQDGALSGASYLEINLRDMAKLAMLYLNGGEFNGRIILSSEWVNQTFTVQNTLGQDYGYMWWYLPGNGTAVADGVIRDHKIYVLPEKNMVVATQCRHTPTGLYSDMLLNDYILPSILS